MPKKLLFVYNPLAGKAQITGYLSKIIDIFTKAGYLVTARPTLSRGDGAEVIKEYGRRHDLVVCSGGDGTLCEAVTGLMAFEPSKRPPLGYIPAGSTNDFASTIGISKDMAEAANMIVHGIPLLCDIGAFDDKYFTYVAAFGAFTSVSYTAPQQVKNLLGHTAYILEGIKQVGSIRPYRLKVSFGERTIEDDFLFGMVSNTLQVGGMKLPSEMAFSINDGLFEVLLVRAPKSIADVQGMIADALLQDTGSKSFLNFKASKVRFECAEAVPWTLDGEFGGEPKSVVIENVNKAIGIIV